MNLTTANPNWPRFEPGEPVICVNSDCALGGLKQNGPYVISKQTQTGYVWVKGIIQPYIAPRFETQTEKKALETP